MEVPTKQSGNNGCLSNKHIRGVSADESPHTSTTSSSKVDVLANADHLLAVARQQTLDLQQALELSPRNHKGNKTPREAAAHSGADQANFTEQVSHAVSKEFIRILREQNGGLEARIDALESRLLQRIETLVGHAGNTQQGNERHVPKSEGDEACDIPSDDSDFKCRSTWDKSLQVSKSLSLSSRTSKSSVPVVSGATVVDAQRPRRPSLQHQNSIWDYDDVTDKKKKSKELNETILLRMVVHPSSKACMAWDLAGVIWIAYDTIVIPLFLTFPVKHVPFTVVMFWMTLIFWTLDIVLTFFKGFYRGTELEVRPCWIAGRYLRTWFLLDLAIVGVDWVAIAVGSDPTGNEESSNQATRLARIGKATRALRIIRSLRLLRLVKLRQLWNEIQDKINSEFVLIILTVLKLVCMIISVAHIIACVWYALGNTEEGWVSKHGFDDASVSYSYLKSLHWGLAQFTPASNELKPHTTVECLFALVVLIGGLIISALLISSITAAMSELKRLNSRATKELTSLRRYLRQREIPWQLALRIRKYSEFVIRLQRKQIQEKDVDLLKLISTPLQKSLAFAVYKSTLTMHGMFYEYGHKDLGAFQTLCQTATQTMHLAKDDIIFTAGQKAVQMLFVKRGMLWYYNEHSPDSPTAFKSISFSELENGNGHSEGEGTHNTVGSSDWCAEAALWTDWHHVGTLVAKTVCELVGVSAEKFADITSKHREVHMMCSEYAERYVKCLNELDADALTDLKSASVDHGLLH